MIAIPENSGFRIIWDLFILILIIISSLLIPYQIAFRHQAYGIGSGIIYLIDLFFLVDIYLNFFTTYRQRGIEITDKHRTATHYLKTVFLLDLIANFPIDVFFLIIDDVRIYNISLVLILRVFRLLRLMRLFVIFRRWQDLSWTNSGFMRIMKFFVTVMLIIHWIACAWFLVPFIESFPEDSWVTIAKLKGADPGTQYIRSLYWAIVTMTTVGYGDITPHRNIEYVFTMLVMLIGASTYAFIIGNIASLVSNLDSTKANFFNKIEAINQYLRSRNVPHDLNEQVRNYYEYLWAHHRGLKEDVLFNDLPIPFRLDVLLHLTRDLIEKVPIFKLCSPSLRNTLLMALKPQTYSPNVYVVREGEVGKEIYFLSSGRIEIISDEGKKTHSILESGDYFGHLSLILREKRTASARALTYCEIFVLIKEDFERIKNEYSEFREVLTKISSEKTDKISAQILEGLIL